MNLLERISLRLLYIAVHKTPPLKRTPDSRATPLGHKSYREVNPQASLDEGVERARNRSYVPFGEEMSDAEDEAFWRDHPELARFRHVRGGE